MEDMWYDDRSLDLASYRKQDKVGSEAANWIFYDFAKLKSVRYG